LKLIIDAGIDIENAIGFVKYSEFVDWFFPQELQFVFSKKFSSSERNKIIVEYTKYMFRIKKTEIRKGVEETRKKWAKIEGKYYDFIEKIFEGHPWPKGKYVGYVSVYRMFPRDIKEKTFHFPYSADIWDPLRTIAHEMMHFIFFDYIGQKYRIKEENRIRGKNPKYIWQISETFNTVIENRKSYQDIFSAKENCQSYPGCEKMFEVMKKQWSEKQNIESLLGRWLSGEILK